MVCRGEPGIGKTRLAHELAARASAKCVPAVWGRARHWRGASLLAVAAALAGYRGGGGCGGARRRVRAHRRSRPARPDVFLTSAQSADTGSSEDRFRLFDAVGLLRHVAARTPVVIILDDVHSADQPTLLLLQHVARTPTRRSSPT